MQAAGSRLSTLGDDRSPPPNPCAVCVDVFKHSATFEFKCSLLNNTSGWQYMFGHGIRITLS